MAYYTGTANDMAAVRQALIEACTLPAEGWAWDGSSEVLSKGPTFVRLSLAGNYLRLYGRASATAGEMPVPRQMGPFGGHAQYPLPGLIWPVQYRLFVFPQEVYCVIQYGVDVFQWCAFGQSTVNGLAGTGTWVEATAAGALTYYQYGLGLSNTSGWLTNVEFCPAPFWAMVHSADYGSNVHSDLDGQGWSMLPDEAATLIGVSAIATLINVLPNTWNSEAVLLPIRAYRLRPAGKVSLVADLEHARYTRIDNYAPGQIIDIGGTRWMILPFYRKNSDARSGGDNHSGTLGWAIRYEGP